MLWIFYNYHPKYPYQKKVWVKVRFLHVTESSTKFFCSRFLEQKLLLLRRETDKAILVYCDGKKI